MKTSLLFVCLSLSLSILAIPTWSGASPSPTETFAVIGDAGRTNTSSASVRDSIVRAGVTKLVLPGDNLYSGTYAAVWAPWTAASLTTDVVAIGNHNGGYPQETAFFRMPAEYYSKVIGRARFIVLNSDNDGTATAQAAFLDRELKAATEPFIFLVYHHPSYTVSAFHMWQERQKFQKAIRPLIWTHRAKLTALLVGHDHLATIVHFNDLPVVLSGAVQEVRRDHGVDYKEDAIQIRTAWYFDDSPYWVKLTVGDSPSARVDYVRAKDDKLSCTATIRTGKPAELQPNCAEHAKQYPFTRDAKPKPKSTRPYMG